MKVLFLACVTEGKGYEKCRKGKKCEEIFILESDLIVNA